MRNSKNREIIKKKLEFAKKFKLKNPNIVQLNSKVVLADHSEKIRLSRNKENNTKKKKFFKKFDQN